MRWAVLVASGLRLLRAAETDEAVRLIAEGEAPVVLADVRRGPALIGAVRARPELAAVHVVVCADLDSPQELREALDSGADDVMRIPFEPRCSRCGSRPGCARRGCGPTRRCCARWSTASPAPSTAARATATGRWSG